MIDVCGAVGIHNGMGIFERVASYELREEEKKVVMVEDRNGVVCHFRVRAALLQVFLRWWLFSVIS